LQTVCLGPRRANKTLELSEPLPELPGLVCGSAALELNNTFACLIEFCTNSRVLIVRPAQSLAHVGQISLEAIIRRHCDLFAQAVGLPAGTGDDLVCLGSGRSDLSRRSRPTGVSNSGFSNPAGFQTGFFLDVGGLATRPLKDPILCVEDSHHGIVYRHLLRGARFGELLFEFGDPLGQTARVAFQLTEGLLYVFEI
jgi:hypothetical protein